MPASMICTTTRIAAPTGLRPRRAQRVTVRATALLPTDHNATSGRLLPLLSDLVQAQASVARFERLAGRSAMVGAAVALVTEALLPSSGGLFGAIASTSITAEFGAVALFLLCCSVGTAASLQRPFSRRLLEPVMASLTSKRRSFSGVSGQNATVDGALDSALNSVFDTRFIMENYLLQEDEKYI